MSTQKLIQTSPGTVVKGIAIAGAGIGLMAMLLAKNAQAETKGPPKVFREGLPSFACASKAPKKSTTIPNVFALSFRMDQSVGLD